MKKYLLCFITLLGCIDILIAQQWFSSNQISSTGSVISDKMVKDNYQNTYITGTFTGELITKNGNVETNGNTDIFLGKYNDEQREDWIITIGGSGGTNVNREPKLAITDDGLLISGGFVGECNFGSGNEAITLTATGRTDIFLAKYGFDGTFKWVKQVISGHMYIDAILVDSSGDILLGGRAFNTDGIFFGEETPSMSRNGGFIVKYSKEGNRLWYNTMTNIGNVIGIEEISSGYVISGTAQNNLIIKSNSETEGNSIYTGKYTNKNYIYIINLSQEGLYNSIICGETDGNSASSATLYTMAIYDDYIYLGGVYKGGDLTFNDIELGFLPSNNGLDIFQISIQVTGEINIGSMCISASGTNMLYDIKIENDILYVAGEIASATIFNRDKLPAGMFVSAYSIEHPYFYPIGAVEGISGNSATDAKALVFSPTGYKLTGTFQGSINIEGTEYNTSGGTNYSTYMAKGALIACIDSIDGKNIEGHDATAANGELVIDVRGLLVGSAYEINWSKNGVGVLPQYKNQTHVTGLDAGEYTARLSYNDNRSSRTRTFQITAPDAFAIANIEMESPSCDDPDPKGKITVTTIYQGEQTVEYHILQTTDKDLHPIEEEDAHEELNTTGIFENCPPGVYSVTIRLQGTSVEETRSASLLLENIDNPVEFRNISATGYDCNLLNNPDEIGVISVEVNSFQDWYALVDASSGATVVSKRATENQTAYLFEDLTPSTYQIWAGSGSCAAKSSVIPLTEPPALIINSAIPVRETCLGNNDGMIRLNVTGGVNLIHYTLYTASEEGEKVNLVRGPQTDDSFINLEPGNYIVAVTDGNAADACFSEIQLTIEPGYKVQVELVNGSLKESCYGQTTGRFNVHATGSSSNAYSFYLYAWEGHPNSEPTNATGEFAGLAPNSIGYDVKAVGQVYGCEATLSLPVIISELSQLAFSNPVATHVLCKGNQTGAVIINSITGGSGIYTVKLSKEGEPVDEVSEVSETQLPVTFSNLGAGTYAVTIEDSYGCTAVAPKQVIITEPLETLTIQWVSQSDVGCYGDNSGALVYAASGGTAVGAYTYTLLQGGEPIGTPNDNGQFTGLYAGTYTVKVTDDNGCETVSSPVSILQEPAMEFELEKLHVTCNGGANGSIEVLGVTGGASPYAYTLRNASNQIIPPSTGDAALFPDLNAGMYRLTVKDDHNCSKDSANIEITQPDPIVISSVVPTPASCSPGSDGTLTVTATGEGTLEYSLNGVNYQTSNTFEGLAAGTYTVTVKDGNGCTAVSAETTIGNTPDPVISSVVPTPASCDPGSDGKLTVTATGEGTLEYSINGGVTYQASHVFEGLATGAYTVTVKDGNGCTAVSTETIIGHTTDPVISSVVATPEGCDPGSNGTLTITATGAGTLQYSLDGVTYLPGNVLGGLTAGTYTVTVKDGNGCTAVSEAVTIGKAPNPVVSAAMTRYANCERENATFVGGEITATATGTGTLEYSLNDGTYQAGNVFTGLNIGKYTVMVKDENGCTAVSEEVEVTNSTPSVTAEIVSEIACFGETGVIKANPVVEGTVVDYYVYKDAIEYAHSANNPEFKDLATASYSFKIFDNYNCSAESDAVALTQPLLLSAEIEATGASGATVANGKITVTISGGTEPYTTRCNGSTLSDNPAIFTGLLPTDYSVVVRDRNGCERSYASKVGILTGIDDMEASPLKIYPNPNDGNFVIEWNSMKDQQVTVEIYTTSGRLVYKNRVQTGTGSARTAIDLSQQANGTYILHVPELKVNEKILISK